MPYKQFTNGSPLPASDLNTYLMNQSVMVFANSTARSAALTAPTEGMVTYLEDTNKVEVYTGAAWVDINDNSAAILKSTVTATGDLIIGNGNASVTRLGIGTNGQVLSSNGSTAVWTNPAGGGGMTLLSTTSLSGTSVAVTGISQAYKDLIIEVVNAYTAADDQSLNLYVANSSGSNLNVAAGGRQYQGGWTDLRETTFMNLTNRLSISSSNLFSIRVLITNYAVSSEFRPLTWFGGTQGGNAQLAFGFGAVRNTSSAIARIQLETSSTFSGGSVRLYGVS